MAKWLLTWVISTGAVLLGICPGLTAARADADTQPAVERVEVGLKGHFKVGEWTSLRVWLASPAKQPLSLQLTAPDSDDLQVNWLGRPQAAGAAQLEILFRPGRAAAPLQISIVTPEGAVLWNQTLGPRTKPQGFVLEYEVGLRLNHPLWLAIGEFPGLSAVVPAGPAPLIITLAAPQELPTSPQALAAVDLMFLTTRTALDPASPAALTPNADRVIHSWVLDGGHAVVIGSDELLSLRDGTPFGWLPYGFSGSAKLRQVTSVEDFSGQNIPLAFAGTVNSLRLDKSPPQVLASSSVGPVFARAPLGFGIVTLSTLDLTSEPFASWRPLPSVLANLATLRHGRAQKTSQHSTAPRLSNIGVSDLATQLHGALQDFDTVRRPGILLVLGAILFQLLLLGPLDYLLVTRLLKRPHWTWFTLPALVLLGTTLTAISARAWNGRQTLLNQCDIVDVDIVTGHVRGQSWATLYANETKRFDLNWIPRHLGIAASDSTNTKTVRVALMGPPEDRIGGLYRAGAIQVSQSGYNNPSEAGTLQHLPAAQWSTRTAVADWSGQIDGASLAESKLESLIGGRLQGTLTQRLDAPLEDCMLVHAGRVYFPPSQQRRLSPGQNWAPTGPRDVRLFLTRTQASRQYNQSREEIVVSAESWDPLNHNFTEIVRMLTFHGAADGIRYTGLSDAGMRRSELSSLIDLDRAILFGRLAIPLAVVSINGQPIEPAKHQGFVRLVLPVTRARSSSDDRPITNEVLKPNP